MWKQSAPGSPVEETAWQGQFKTWRKCLSLISEPRKKSWIFWGFFLSLPQTPNPQLISLSFFKFFLGQPLFHWGASRWAQLLFLKTPEWQVWAVSSQHPPLLLPHSSFLSSSCQWLLWTIRGWLSQHLRPQHLNLWPGSYNSGASPGQETRLSSSSVPAFCYLFIADC